MTDPEDRNDPLEPFFAAARGRDEVPDAAFLSRVLADAEAQRITHELGAEPSGFFAALGGWRGMGGLIAASLAGLWIGTADPGLRQEVTAGLLGADAGVDALYLAFSDPYDLALATEEP